MIDSRYLVLAWLGFWWFATIAVGLATARADADKTVRAPEVYLIGEPSTYMVDDTTITVEPGVLVLYN